MRKILALFFLFIFSLQALPVKAISKMLAKSQQTEEVKDDCPDTDDTDDDCKEDGTEKYSSASSPHNFFYAVISAQNPDRRYAIHQDDELPCSLSRDVICPPPNC